HTRSITTTRALGSGSVGSSRRAGGRTGSTSGSSNGSGSHPGPSDSTPSQLSIGGHFTTPPRRKRIDRARAMLRNVPNQKLDPRDRHPYRFLEDILGGPRPHAKPDLGRPRKNLPEGVASPNQLTGVTPSRRDRRGRARAGARPLHRAPETA